MYFLQHLRNNFSKKSFLIKRINKNTAASSSHKPTWPEWSGWNDTETAGERLHTDSYLFCGLKNKLILSKDILIKERFQFKEWGSSVDLSEQMFLLFSFDGTSNSHPFKFQELSIKLESYFEYIAGREKCLLYLCINPNKLVHFCDQLIENKFILGSVKNNISTITTFALEDTLYSGRKTVLSNYSGNIRSDWNPWTQITNQSKGKVAESSSKAPHKHYSTDAADVRRKITQNSPLLKIAQTTFCTDSRQPPSLDKKVDDLFKTDVSVKTDASLIADASVESRIAAKMESLSCSGKPPNILVYTGSNEETSKRFINVLLLLQQCLSREHYAVYHLKHSQVTTTPWIQNTVLLVIAADKVPKQGISECFLAYFVNGGTIFTLASDFDQLFLNRCQDKNDQESPRVIHFNYLHHKDVSVLGGSGSYGEMDSSHPHLTFTSLATHPITNNHLLVLVQHASDKGSAILSRISFDKDLSDTTISSDVFVSLKQSNPARISILQHLLSTLSLNCSLSPPPPLTPFLLFSPLNHKVEDFLRIVGAEMEEKVYTDKKNSYQFLTSHLFAATTPLTTATFSPVITDADNFHSEFDLKSYKRHLNTRVLGNVAFYADVVTTTMTVMQNYMHLMPEDMGLVVIATTQTAGLGRGGNVWLSPKGCGLFSLHIRFPLSSPLGHHLSCVQHLVALAIVMAVREKEGYEDIDMRIKWPNDVYYGDRLKLGGVLVRSTILHDTVHVNLGCGLNISNKDPTLCVNDLITQFNNNKNSNHNNKKNNNNINTNYTNNNTNTPNNYINNTIHTNNNTNHTTSNNTNNNNATKNLALFSVEEFVARLINQIEDLIDNFQADQGESFFDLYYKYWLHSDQLVRLNSIDGPRGVIVGLSRYGFLSVRLEDGTLTEVHPDGNSFDMMKNLIAPKIRR